MRILKIQNLLCAEPDFTFQVKSSQIADFCICKITCQDRPLCLISQPLHSIVLLSIHSEHLTLACLYVTYDPDILQFHWSKFVRSKNYIFIRQAAKSRSKMALQLYILNAIDIKSMLDT